MIWLFGPVYRSLNIDSALCMPVVTGTRASVEYVSLNSFVQTVEIQVMLHTRKLISGGRILDECQ